MKLEEKSGKGEGARKECEKEQKYKNGRKNKKEEKGRTVEHIILMSAYNLPSFIQSVPHPPPLGSYWKNTQSVLRTKVGFP